MALVILICLFRWPARITTSAVITLVMLPIGLRRSRLRLHSRRPVLAFSSSTPLARILAGPLTAVAARPVPPRAAAAVRAANARAAGAAVAVAVAAAGRPAARNPAAARMTAA